MIIQIGTEVDESRILWKYSEDDEWKSIDIDELIDSYENNYTESYEMQIDDLKKEIDELKREISFLKHMQKYVITNGTDYYVPPCLFIILMSIINRPDGSGISLLHKDHQRNSNQVQL